MTTDIKQFIRKGSVVVSNGSLSMDLSDFHYTFSIQAMDTESPNNARVRIYNLSDKTADRIKGEFSRILISAGYEGNVGKIFEGTIKQIKRGREDNISRYVELFSADSDLGYNFGIVNQAIKAGSNPLDRIKAIAPSLGSGGAPLLPDLSTVNPASLSRGKVMFGMARTVMRDEAENLDATWSIQKEKVQVIGMRSYLPNEVVELTSQTGMIGVPEQTDQGISVRCLINPKLVVGGLIKINNAAINQLTKGVFDVPFNQWTGIQFAASTASDGLYRVYVIDYNGDIRGQPWYCDLVCLAINPSNKVSPVVCRW